MPLSAALPPASRIVHLLTLFLPYFMSGSSQVLGPMCKKAESMLNSGLVQNWLRLLPNAVLSVRTEVESIASWPGSGRVVDVITCRGHCFLVLREACVPWRPRKAFLSVPPSPPAVSRRCTPPRHRAGPFCPCLRGPSRMGFSVLWASRPCVPEPQGFAPRAGTFAHV